MRFWFLLFTTALFATVNEPLRWEVFSGYRNDRIHWHIQNPGEGAELIYSELYRDVQYWENGLTLKVIHRDLLFFVRGSYGAYGRGTLIQRLPGETNTRLDTSGWTADVSGYFSYAVNLTADRLYKVILTPLIGYSAHFERQNPEHMRLSWNGFLLGGGFLVEPNNGLIFNVGYAYNILHNQYHSSKLRAPMQSIKTSSGGNKGQSGWAQIDFELPRYWRLGIGGQINYFFTRVVDATLRQKALSSHSEKFKLRWTAISGWAQLSREF